MTTTTIGTIIKKLRRDKDITQEKLAEFLNISPQAVSRWETDLAMPDITLLPVLANIFNVTTDYLLGVDITRKQERIKEYDDRAHKFLEVGHVKEAIAVRREALLEFPNDYGVMRALASELFFNNNNSDNDEALKLCEKIYEECTDNETRTDAIQVLVYLYAEKGDIDKAKKIANTMPNMYLCSSSLLSHVLTGFELLCNERGEIGTHFELMMWNIIRISKDEMYLPHDIVELYLQCERIGKAVFAEDFDEIVKYNGLYQNIAYNYAKLGDADNTIKYLEKAMNNATATDTKPPHLTSYTMKSLLFKGYTRAITFSKNYDYNQSMELLKEINEHKEYDFLRDDYRLQNIITGLEKYAKYE
jgi:Predicted transcriptional regulators